MNSGRKNSRSSPTTTSSSNVLGWRCITASAVSSGIPRSEARSGDRHLHSSKRRTASDCPAEQRREQMLIMSLQSNFVDREEEVLADRPLTIISAVGLPLPL